MSVISAGALSSDLVMVLEGDTWDRCVSSSQDWMRCSEDVEVMGESVTVTVARVLFLILVILLGAA